MLIYQFVILIDIDYYSNLDEDLPKSIQLTKMLVEMQSVDTETETEKPLKPIPEKILSYFKPYVNDKGILNPCGCSCHLIYPLCN